MHQTLATHMPRPLAIHQSLPSSSSAASSSQPEPIPLTRRSAVPIIGQTMQLLLANAALILWPSALIPGSIADGRLWLLFCAYCVFFGMGTLTRIIKYGPLAPRSSDKQIKDIKSKLALVAFVISMPILHWLPILFYLRDSAPHDRLFQYFKGQIIQPSEAFCLDIIGSSFILSAIVLTATAANHLGSAYDRIIAPSSLVTTGPYSFSRHPIYLSYILLFVGFAFSLHSISFAALLAAVCLFYYRQRIRIEEDLLGASFGEEYKRYQAATKMLIPFVW